MNVRDVFLIAILLGVCSLAECRSSSPACTPGPDKNTIVFVSTEGGGWDIYTMNADGTCKTRLTHTVRDEYKPVWSPDGTLILFEGTPPLTQRSNLYVMDADGLHTILLTRQGWDATWSPDGTQIAFVSYRDSFGALYVMNADGSHQTRLTDFEIGPLGPIWKPSWSPDGQQIVFSSAGKGNDIYTANVDGSGVYNLTNDPDEASVRPIWSSDGRYILFELLAARGQDEICMMNANGSNVRCISKEVFDYDVVWGWGPDERSISIEVSEITGGILYRWLYMVDVNCVFEHQSVEGNLPEDCYSRVSLPGSLIALYPGGWSPNGTLLVLEVVEVDEQKCDDQRRGCEDYEVYVIGVDGTGFVNLTDNIVLDSDPTWSP
jgi:Tol biopolymer transport system component